MRVTRRYVAVVAVGGFLAALGVVLVRPVVLLGAVVTGAWLLARQYAFVRALDDVLAADPVTHTVVPERPRADDTVTVTLGLSLPAGQPLHVAVEMQPPVATTGSDAAERTLRLAPGDTGAETVATLRCPVAGRFAFGRPRLRASDPLGLFVATAPVGPAPTLEVAARTPDDIHVGQGGDPVGSPYGTHTTEQRGSGLEPAELREYVPGDAASRIDWKATARLATPYVMEFQAETDRRTVLLVDHRETTGEGEGGETALDYLRQVALAIATAAQAYDDPLGFYAVGDDGPTAAVSPDTTPGHYRGIRDRLLGLRPTTASGGSNAGGPSPGGDGRGDPAAARRAAARLEGDPSAFASRLAPFFAAADPYIERLAAEPLFRTARAYVDQLGGQRWTVLLTDDRRPTEVTETVRLLRRHNNRVVALLAPTVLYTPGGLADLDAAYEQYREFEELRRDLDGLDRVTALEVAPDERVDALLTARRDRRNRVGVGGR